MDDVKKTLLGLLDPRGTGKVPRRAVLLDCGLIVDRTEAPDKPEVHVVSQIARAVFDTEPRDPNDLLHRALVLNVPSAWDALKDDLVLGYSFVLPNNMVSHAHRHLVHHPTPAKAYVCSRLLLHTDVPKNIFDDLPVGAIADMPEDAVLAVQTMLQALQPDVAKVAKVLRDAPNACRLFLTHTRLSQLPYHDPQLLDHLCEHAASVPVKLRYPTLALVAVVCQSGVRFSHDVGVQTLEALAKTKFDVKLAAAAAVVAGPKCTLSPLIETLAAAVQKL